jgi:FMN-dependent NADH-azoreductase
MKILRIQTSPHGENSESRKLGDHLIAKAKRIDLAVTTIVRDLSTGVAAGKGRLMH